MSDHAVRRARRARSLALLGAAGLLFAALALVAILTPAEPTTLERVGERVPGRVVQVDPRSARPGTVGVTYSYRGENRASVVASPRGGPVLAVGDEVTVLVDPADPDTIGILSDAGRRPGSAIGPMIALAVLAVASLVSGSLGFRRSR